MNIKTILVHVAGDDQAEKRLTVATELARVFDAHVTALHIPRFAEEGTFGRGASASYRAEMERLAAERADKQRAAFESACQRAGLTNRWVREDEAHFEALEKHARVADLLVLSQSHRTTVEDYFSKQLTEQLVMTSGVPVLILPRDWELESIEGHVMVAWKSSRESVRALRDALPFMAKASKVTLLSVGDPEESGDLGADQAALYLARHGIEAEVRQDFDSNDVGEVILKQRRAIGADILVMGAYGRTSWRKAVFGGATGYAMTHMDCPVIVSH